MAPNPAKWRYQLVAAEAKQRIEEGCNSSEVNSILSAINESSNIDDITKAYNRLSELPIRPDFGFEEPSRLEDIKSASEGYTNGIKRFPEALEDRMLGAWLGRCSGCALGKPLERQPYMQGLNGVPGWQNVRTYLKAANAWPIEHYVPNAGVIGDLDLGCPDSCRENIRFMETDDDIRYTILGLKILEEVGPGFTTADVGKYWFALLPVGQTFTAERQTYRNFIDLVELNDFSEESLEWARSWWNPYREWIGAQIRADGWAYCAAGDPALAAEFAYRDAALSHVKNGIYGEMIFAAAISAGFICKTPLEALYEGLKYIPKASRLHKDILQAIEMGLNIKDLDELHEALWKTWGHYDGVHTNNNAALVAASIAYGGDDFEKVIVASVTGGWDTDCNGATAGSLWGAVYGASKLPEKWIQPLNDTLYAAIPDFHPIAISECARRSIAVYKKVQKK